MRGACTYCTRPSRRLDNLRQDVEKPYPFLKPRTPTLIDGQSWDNKTKGWHVRYEEHPKTPGAAETEENEALALNPNPWRKPSTAKEVPTSFTLHSNAVETGYNKLTELQGINMTSISTGSNHLEISKAMKKISEINQLLAQQQMAQQKTLQALLYHQEQTGKVQEASQRIQSQALMTLTEAIQQRGFNPLFKKIAKCDGKDPKKLNQVWVACMESGRNFHQSLMFCAEDAVLAIMSGLNPGLMDEQVNEEIMRCFSPTPTRRQAIEKLRAMHQEPDEQM